MPSATSTKPVRHTVKLSQESSLPSTSARKRRVARRRGRNQAESDEDEGFERDLPSGSESESTVSDDSDSESVDSTSALHSPIATPSEQPVEPSAVDATAGGSKPVIPIANGIPVPLFNETMDWSEMVSAEDAQASGAIPLLDFSDLGNMQQPVPSSSAEHTSATAPHPGPPTDQDSRSARQTSVRPPRGDGIRRPPIGVAARQAYKDRLATDPSYVPTVGGFWGHDDRLLDRDLRSLSSWWRGMWRGRGRGAFGARGNFRGTARGGFSGTAPAGEPSDPDAALVADQPWTHDGFEDMKRREESRRARIKQEREAEAQKNQRVAAPIRAAGDQSIVATSIHYPKVWFNIKPEQTWTKQFDGYLFMDFSLRTRVGKKEGLRIKFPGLPGRVAWFDTRLRQASPKRDTPLSRPDDYSPVVKLPPTRKRRFQPVTNSANQPEPLTTVTEELVIHSSEPQAGPSTVSQSTAEPAVPVSQTPPPEVDLKPEVVEQTDIPVPESNAQPSVMMDTQPMAPPNGVMHRQQPQAYPMPPPQPQYGFGFPPPLPPGVGMSSNGIPYELSTGRPVFIPSQSNIYNPQPMPPPPHMPPPFVPGVTPPIHTPSPVSMSSPVDVHAPHMANFAPAGAGPPIFSLPRTMGPIEIRAPSHDVDGKSQVRRSSNLRDSISAPPFMPAAERSAMAASYPQMDSNATSQGPPAPQAYNPYQYYYPPPAQDQYQYPYVDYSALPQFPNQPGSYY